MGLGLGFGLEKKDQKKIKDDTKPLMANLDITHISCKFENSQLRSSTSRERTATLIDKRTYNVYDIICCEVPLPNKILQYF